MWAFYAGAAVVLLPWIGNLSYALPARHTAPHWDVAWVGFDCAIFIALVLTAYFSFRKSGWVVVAATMAFTLLAIDAWFDIWTSHPGRQLAESVLMAALVELPLAVLSLWLARRAAISLLAKRPS